MITNLRENLNNDFEVVEASKVKPKIKIVNFLNTQKWQNEEIEDAIKSQNEKLFADKDIFKIVNSFEHKNSNSKTTLTAEVNGALFQKLMKEKKLSIGWCICVVFDAAQVTRCFKCSRFSHIERNCKATKAACPKCAGDHKQRVQIVNCKMRKLC